MLRANQRAYRDAAGWIKAARPPGVSRTGFAARRLLGSFMAGVVVMGVLSLADPGAFGQTGPAYSLGWGGWVVVALTAAALGDAYLRRRKLAETARRLREPLLRPLDDHPEFEGACGALAACDPAFVTRFGLAWVWAPAAAFVVGALFSFSDAYFLVDSLLARFEVGWGTGVLAAVDLGIALACFGLAARRLSTIRLAASVHKHATTGYALEGGGDRLP